MRASSIAMLGLTVSLLPSAVLGAQEWRLGAQAGRIRSAIDPSAQVTDALSAGIRFDAARTAFAISAGIPTTGEEPLWGAAALWQRLAHRTRTGLIVGLDASGTALLSRDRSVSPLPGGGGIFDPPTPPGTAVDRDGTAFAGQLLPLVGIERGRMAIHARGGVSHFRSRIGSEGLDRTVPFGDLQFTVQPRHWFALVPTVRHYRPADEPALSYVGVTAVAASPRARIAASVGTWSHDAADGTPWSLSGRLELVPRVALEASARRDALDPLHLQPAQTSWSAGLSIRFGTARRMPALPIPASYRDGIAKLELPVKHAPAGTPSIAGDFTGWQPVPMERHGTVWRFTRRLEPGVYHYAFVAADGRWFVPEDVPGRRDDGMGGHVAVVVVE